MSDIQQEELSSDRWSEELLTRVSRQRADNRHLCDVIVRCDDGVEGFPGHRNVLAASSEYFRALFTNRLAADSDGIYDVTISWSQLGVSRDAVENVLDFMYSGRITLSVRNVAEVLRLADFLCVSALISTCVSYMNSVHLKTPELCLSFLQLVETFRLSQVSEPLAVRVRQSVSQQLPQIFAVVAEMDDHSPCIARRLLDDPEIGSVSEPEICDAICRLATKRADDVTVLDLLHHVEFDYLGTSFVRQRLLTNHQLTNWLCQERPEILAALRENVDRQSADGMVDIVVCSRRHPPVRDAAARLLLYIIPDDEWVGLRSLAIQDDLESSMPGSDCLAGLECLVTEGPWLYALCSVQPDAVSYFQPSVVVKHFFRLDLSRSDVDKHWQMLQSPRSVQSQCRLIVAVDGIYVIDRAGVVERYSTSTDAWKNVNVMGFPIKDSNATRYVLPMLVGGSSQLYALRVYSCGVGPCCFASHSLVLYALDHRDGDWKTLERSEIDIADLLYTSDHNKVNFHSYVARPGSLTLLDDIARNTVCYDFAESDWKPSTVTQNGRPRPNFVGDVLGCVTHAGRVYCACERSAVYFVMYDVTRQRYKAVCRPPDSPSGVMCHARLPRSSLAQLTFTCTS